MPHRVSGQFLSKGVTNLEPFSQTPLGSSQVLALGWRSDDALWHLAMCWSTMLSLRSLPMILIALGFQLLNGTGARQAICGGRWQCCM